MDKLGQKHVIRIVLFLYTEGPYMKTEIYSNISWNSNMSKKVDILEDNGLMSKDVCFREYTYRLTDKGTEVAKALMSIKIIMEGPL